MSPIVARYIAMCRAEVRKHLRWASEIRHNRDVRAVHLRIALMYRAKLREELHG